MTRFSRPQLALAGALLLLATAGSAHGTTPCAVTVLAGAGPKPSDIQAIVADFRAALGGPDNGGAPGPLANGRREITWDGVPDASAAPNFLPADFFRSRGLILSTPGDGVQVSADANNPAHAAQRFGHIHATYASQFKTFSAPRLFSPIGSNVVDLTFVIPGSDEVAVVRGFGAVYTDVDKKESSFEYFDKDGASLGTFSVPRSNQALSFLGVVFGEPVVARVRITYGNTALGPRDGGSKDVAVMDNFLAGEPQGIPQ